MRTYPLLHPVATVVDEQELAVDGQSTQAEFTKEYPV